MEKLISEELRRCADELASWAGTISYEMLLAPTARVPVIYSEPAGETYAGSSEKSEKE